MQKIFGKIQDLLEKKDKIIIAIEGRSASGKSRVADFIKSKIDCNVFCTDDFCLSDKQRENKDRGFANIDTSRFRNEVIANLQRDGSFDYDKFNCKRNVYSKYVVVEQSPVNIVEGVYSCCEQLRDHYDLKIFLQVDGITQKTRLAQAEPFERMDEFLAWEEDYFERQNPHRTNRKTKSDRFEDSER